MNSSRANTSIIVLLLLFCLSVRADYYCVKNDTGQILKFQLIDNHYDVYRYEYQPKQGGLTNRTELPNNETITLLPNDRVILRTMFSYLK